jgi:diguanylate cyclase
MKYTEDVHKAAELTRLILPALAQLEIPVNPVNYALWYEYYLGRNEDLNDTIEKITNGTQPYDEKTALELFVGHVLNPGAEKIQMVQNEARRLLSSIIDMTTKAGDDVTSYGHFLGQSIHQIEGDSELSRIQLVVSSLFKETNVMVDTNRKFEKQLQVTTEEMSLLRQELSKIRKQAALDPLTGVANRMTFDDSLNKAIDTAISEDKDLCLLMVDMDYFKRVNDQHGHLIGDKVLKFLSGTLKRMVKGKDLVARYGGDEFGIILEDTPESGAFTLAENIRKEVEKSKLKRTATGERLGNPTVSIGLAAVQPGDDKDSLVERADKALYEAKNSGRNMVKISGK